MQNIEIVRSKRRSLSVEVSDTARIIVRAPKRLSQDRIDDFLNKNASWIEKTYKNTLNILESLPIRLYEEGELLQYLGVSYPIVKTLSTSVKLDEQFFVPKKDNDICRELLQKWYTKKAHSLFTERVAHFSQKMGVAPKVVRITNAKKRWGSYSSTGTISFSWRLMLAPIFIIDYVIVHELSHITHMNHSKKFWSKVESYYGEHAYAKKWLNKHSSFISLQ